MRIGLMLRGIDKRGGSGVYATNLVPELLRQGTEHEWVLLYASEEQLGSVEVSDGVEEVVLRGRNFLSWDQIRVPRFASKDGLDLLFHTKFTVPFFSPVPCVMALHGASWYVIPRCYPWWDVAYIKRLMPWYCRRAAHMVSNSQCTTRDYVNLVGAAADKITTIPLAAAPFFRRVSEAAELERARGKYGLPENFVLSVSAYDPRKNVPRLLEAFARCSREVPCHLVLIGKQCDRFRDDHPDLMEVIGDRLITPGWVDQEDLPAIYSLATVFFFPSLYEEFGIPNCEAMACGTPIVTSTTGAPPDVVGDAGILVHPEDTDGMTVALVELLTNPERRAELSCRGLERSRQFSWERTARRTLDVLERVGGSAAG